MTETAPTIRRKKGTKPSSYDAVLVRNLLADYDGAATVVELSALLGITSHTFNQWMKTRAEFKALVMDMRRAALERIHSAMYRRAVGYDHTTVEQKAVKDGESYEVVDLEKTTHYPADVAAGKFLLAVRDPENWTERKVVAIESNLRDTLAAVAKNLELDLDPSEWEELGDGE